MTLIKNSCIICGTSVVTPSGIELAVCDSDYCIITVENSIGLHYTQAVCQHKSEPVNQAFDNAERRRKYGKRKGDIVHRYNSPEILCQVTSIEFMDNNRFAVKRLSDGFTFEDTPEHYVIKTKVEDLVN